MDIQSLLNDTMGLLREAIVNQAQQTVEIEKELAKLQAEFEYLKENQKVISIKIDNLSGSIKTLEETARNAQERYRDMLTDNKEQKKDVSNLTVAFAKEVGRITAIIAGGYALLQYLGKN